ncbi:uncharacterized protein LOC111674445 [Orussus abietinus]|uniref:uncharacterized protein LOC111674445 n=1 Tax=Orussus abietinus TaxID=222816 RepID=UPI000C71627F|nr:uncharacterized protein LOC111674445 [Orussus abietinus]
MEINVGTFHRSRRDRAVSNRLSKSETRGRKMSSSPRVRQMPPRPRITLPVPGQYGPYAQTPMGYVTTPYGQTPMPMTPVAGQPNLMYSNKASEFMFAQFRGIKDFTKSGLSVGEKSAFWIYEKVNPLKSHASVILYTPRRQSNYETNPRTGCTELFEILTP